MMLPKIAVARLARAICAEGWKNAPPHQREADRKQAAWMLDKCREAGLAVIVPSVSPLLALANSATTPESLLALRDAIERALHEAAFAGGGHAAELSAWLKAVDHIAQAGGLVRDISQPAGDSA